MVVVKSKSDELEFVKQITVACLLLYLAHWILQTKTQVHRIRKMQLVHSILIGSPNVTLNSFNLLG